MSAAPEFRYTLDAVYLETAHARILALLPAWRRALVRWILPVLMASAGGFFIWRYRGEPLALGFSLAILVGGCVYQMRKDWRARRERFRGTALENALTRVVFGEEGLEIEVVGSRIRVLWNAEVRARAFADGWLLVENSGDARWLPRSGLSSASPEEVDQWLSTRIRDFARVP